MLALITLIDKLSLFILVILIIIMFSLIDYGSRMFSDNRIFWKNKLLYKFDHLLCFSCSIIAQLYKTNIH